MDNKEKINENLEKIKQLCDVEVPYNEVCSIHANALGEIQEAAGRMAAEIERLKNKLREYSCQIKNFQFELEKVHYEKDKEIARIKAELEKRPKIVDCGECYKNGNKDECPFAWVKANNHTGIILYDSTSFCSYGEHRESEEC
jgi:uncharacterized small protein (DUF1192 family)